MMKAQLVAQSLTSTKVRVNALGVLRGESGVMRRYVAEIEATPL
jgi:hypothetical protein